MGTLLLAATIVLAILQAAGVLSIGWLWVFAPLWIPLLLGIALMAAGLIFTTLGAIGIAIKSRERR